MAVATSPKQVPGITEGRGLMTSMSAFHLSRLLETLVHPDRILTDVDKAVAEHTMMEISGGARTENNPNYVHKGEAKPGVKKNHEHSGIRHRDKQKRPPKGAFSQGNGMLPIFSSKK